ncbi:unnamed protein product, partial [Laminaria digitata]
RDVPAANDRGVSNSGGGGRDRFFVGGSGSSSSQAYYGEDDALNDRVERLERRRDRLQHAEYGINAPEHIEGVQTIANMAQNAAE